MGMLVKLVFSTKRRDEDMVYELFRCGDISAECKFLRYGSL